MLDRNWFAEEKFSSTYSIGVPNLGHAMEGSSYAAAF